MNPQQQIAAEAHRQLQDTKQLGGENYQPVITTAIIKNYIEKATERLEDDKAKLLLCIKEVSKERDAWKRVANWDESRAAHASEENQ